MFDQLRPAIVEGDIPAGSKLSEPVLAERFDASRGPLREAMRLPEAINLLERRANVGARFVTLSTERLSRILCDDLYHLARMYRCQLGMKSSDRARDALKEHAHPPRR